MSENIEGEEERRARLLPVVHHHVMMWWHRAGISLGALHTIQVITPTI